ncbi:MAG: ATP-binding cassette domain-containing protein, partial [Gammaproteobacteria bacterium]|nr:ATP-binding cassette domain-containing protein [Gammaproteobacteria bacterium]
LEIMDEKDATDLTIETSTIEFDHVSFAYNENREILRDINFKIPAGKKIAVVGPSGAGKSTLARLIFRFYDTTGGQVKISNHAIKSVTQHSLRKQIGIVPQDTVLFNESIFYNIQYARPSATRDEVIRVCELADIHDFIESLPEGYDTVVGERGLKLSGGEKQRVSIARVLLKNPPILVFDEATSSLDSKSEKNILTSLNTIAENKTTLVIAHRLSTIVDADEILVLEHGEIKEQGNHDQLLEQKGLYASLWAIQQRKRKSTVDS